MVTLIYLSTNVDQYTFTLSIRILLIGSIVVVLGLLLYCYYNKYVLIEKCLLTFEHLGLFILISRYYFKTFISFRIIFIILE